MNSRRESNNDEVMVRFMWFSIAGRGRPAMIIAIAVCIIAVVVALQIL